MSMPNLWPENATDKVIFLLDVSTSTELTILTDLIEHHTDAQADYSVVSLNLQNEKESERNIAKVQASLDKDKSLYFQPVRVVWNPKPRKELKKFNLNALLRLGSHTPTATEQKLIYKATPPPYSIAVGKGATRSDLQNRFDESSLYSNFARFICRAAFLSVDRAERRITGTHYKIPRMVADEVVRKPALHKELEKISESTGRPYSALRKEAIDCLNEMAATPSINGIERAATLGRFMYTRGFEKTVDILPEDLERIRNLLADKPVAFLFTHKSHIDGFFLISLFRDMDLTPIHTFGGINMSFMGLGTLLRNAGAIFIRRSFKNDLVYKAVFRNYIGYLSEKRFPLMWALEGTRSRTGKLMPPRYGILNYVINSHLCDNASDLVLMPISIVYDQVPEVDDYDSLQSGASKKPESVVWFMEYIKQLKKPHGKIHVRFGQGIELNNHLAHDSTETAIGRLDVQKLAFAMAVDVNNATPITVNSLITYVLLKHGHRAITLQHLANEIDRLLSFSKLFDFPATEDVAQLDTKRTKLALQQLASTGVIEAVTDSREDLYMIPHHMGRKAAYYRNGLVQFFIMSAIGELALTAVTKTGDEAIEQFRTEALRIRNLLKFDFFFEASDDFIIALESQFETRFSGWVEFLRDGKESINRLLRRFDTLLAPGILRPFIESYFIYAQALSLAPTDKRVDTKAVIAESLSLGKQMVLQQRIHCEESVSKSHFENAEQLARDVGLFDDQPQAKLQADRATFVEELTRMTLNIRLLTSIEETKQISDLLA